MSARASKILLWALPSALVGCANNPVNSLPCPHLPGGTRYCLQDTSVVAPFTVLQDAHIQQGTRNHRLIVQLEVDAAGMHMVGLTPMGQRLMEAHFDNREATAHSLLEEHFDTRMLLSMIQLSMWPIESVRLGLETGWRIDETPTQRRFLYEEECVLDISRSGEPPHYRNFSIRIPKMELLLTIHTIKNSE